VCVCVCVALVIQHAMRKCHCVMSSVDGSTLVYFATLSHKQYAFKNKVTEHNYVSTIQ